MANNDLHRVTLHRLQVPRGVAVDQMSAVIVGDSGNYRIKFDIGSTHLELHWLPMLHGSPLGDTRFTY